MPRPSGSQRPSGAHRELSVPARAADSAREGGEGPRHAELLHRPSSKEPRWICPPRVESGHLVNILQVSALSDAQLAETMRSMMASSRFRRFAGRWILDIKAFGTREFELSGGYGALKPVVAAMTALASRCLEAGEDLALIQLLVNRYMGGTDEVKPHRHRCRQICLALGAERELLAAGRVHLMRHGDCIPLNGEVHSVPAASAAVRPRISVCLFFCSTLEYARRSISVNATDGKHGSSIWWEHPDDYPRSEAA